MIIGFRGLIKRRPGRCMNKHRKTDRNRKDGNKPRGPSFPYSEEHDSYNNLEYHHAANLFICSPRAKFVFIAIRQSTGDGRCPIGKADFELDLF